MCVCVCVYTMCSSNNAKDSENTRRVYVCVCTHDNNIIHGLTFHSRFSDKITQVRSLFAEPARGSHNPQTRETHVHAAACFSYVLCTYENAHVYAIWWKSEKWFRRQVVFKYFIQSVTILEKIVCSSKRDMCSTFFVHPQASRQL